MRIVAGQTKGRKLLVPKGKGVRPTADRVREALFSSLGQRVDGAVVLDLFAGSGALGLEALSRGAKRAVFVEKARESQQIVGQNIVNLGFESRARIIKGEAFQGLRLLEKEGGLFTLIFLDPPYKQSGESLLEPALNALSSSNLLASGALVVAEHKRDQIPILPESLRIKATKSYGGTGLTMIETMGMNMPMAKEE